MNFTELGNQLHMSRQGAKGLVLRNEKQIKKYIIYKNKQPIGVLDSSIDNIRQLVVRKHNVVDKQNLQLELLNSKIDSLERLLTEREKLIDFYKLENERLNSELSYYRDKSFFQRLLGYRKNK